MKKSNVNKALIIEVVKPIDCLGLKKGDKLTQYGDSFILKEDTFTENGYNTVTISINIDYVLDNPELFTVVTVKDDSNKNNGPIADCGCEFKAHDTDDARIALLEKRVDELTSAINDFIGMFNGIHKAYGSLLKYVNPDGCKEKNCKEQAC